LIPYLIATFQHFEAHKTLNVSYSKLYAFFDRIKKTYRDNPYHRWFHAVDVFQSTAFILSKKCLLEFSTLEIVGLLISAICHDCDHPGLNNAFLINSRHSLALQYNDVSVLENYHTYTAFSVMSQTDSAILSEVSPADYKKIRQIIIECILGTDMSSHFQHVARVGTLLENQNKKDWSEPERKIVMSAILHVADISNPCKPFDTCFKWAVRIQQEFFAQVIRRLR